MKTIYFSILATCSVSFVACCQGFINMDFEDAVVQPLPPDNVLLDWSLAVPGWSSGMPWVYYRQTHLGVAPLYLLMDSTSPVGAPGTQLAGNYSLAFASGHAGNDIYRQWLNVGIMQSGFVPTSARSIRLLGTGPFKIFLGGVEIPMFSLGGNSFGGDISGSAGAIVELKILNTAGADDYTWTIVDNIEFSPLAVPEPASLTLIVLGTAVLLWRNRESRRPLV